MKVCLSTVVALSAIVSVAVTSGCVGIIGAADPPDEADKQEEVSKPDSPIGQTGNPRVAVAEIPEFVHKAVGWLSEAQHENGAWGGGSHANQQNLDPHAVQTDPATTAFAAMALLRAGHTPLAGDHRRTVLRATEYLLSVVEVASENGPKITDITGTQPQAKLGPLVDTSLVAQYLARVLDTVKTDKELHARVDAALIKCLRKLHASQQQDGSWNIGGGWAPVLQSSLSCTALELAQLKGKKVDPRVLERARNYQKKNVNINTGTADAKAAAGVELYAFSGAQRANAQEFREAKEEIDRAKDEGRLDAQAEISEENLVKAGVTAPQATKLARAAQQNNAQVARLDDEQLLAGFGNNGGEEFLSYLMTSESLVIGGGNDWTKWNGKMHQRLEKIQNPDGSWSGHHCITSPVFCTAAVIQCLTTDRDAANLLKVAVSADGKAGGETTER